MMLRYCLIILLGVLGARVYAGETISPEEAWKLGWPAMQGPYGNFRAPRTGVKLVDDLSKARLAWETEDRDFGRAKHTTCLLYTSDAADE